MDNLLRFVQRGRKEDRVIVCNVFCFVLETVDVRYQHVGEVEVVSLVDSGI